MPKIVGCPKVHVQCYETEGKNLSLIRIGLLDWLCWKKDVAKNNMESILWMMATKLVQCMEE